MRITDSTWLRRASLSAPACVNWNPLEDSCLFEAAQSERSGPAVTPDALSEYCPAGGQTFPPRMVEKGGGFGPIKCRRTQFRALLAGGYRTRRRYSRRAPHDV